MPDGEASPLAYIYALRDPRTRSVHYVGQSQEPYQRFWSHLVASRGDRHRPSAKNQWIQSLVEANLKPQLKILAAVDARRALEYERYWLEKLISAGEPLTNKKQLERTQVQARVENRLPALAEMYGVLECDRSELRRCAQALIAIWHASGLSYDAIGPRAALSEADFRRVVAYGFGLVLVLPVPCRISTD